MGHDDFAFVAAFLVTLEETARAAGLTRTTRAEKPAHHPADFGKLRAPRPSGSFSGPLVRGDAETVAKHLAVLEKHAGASKVYVALAQAALRGLPVKNRDGSVGCCGFADGDSVLPLAARKQVSQLLSLRLQ